MHPSPTHAVDTGGIASGSLSSLLDTDYIEVSVLIQLLHRKASAEQQRDILDSERDKGMHTDASGRLTDAFQRRYSEVVLNIKQVKLCAGNCCIGFE